MKNLKYNNEGNNDQIKIENGTQIWHKIKKLKCDINTHSQ